MSTSPAFAAADWGTTRLRVWLVGADGGVLAERRSDDGLLSAAPDGFSRILEAHLAAMQASPALPVLICGMAGSRQGWLEVPYVDAPAGFSDIFAGAAAVPGLQRRVLILPGVAQRAVGRPDVMRGEETQLAGIVAGLPAGAAVACMPGTHSKWVEIEAGRLARFSTFMTGELFSVLSAHSILRHSLAAGAPAVARDDPAFIEGVRRGFAEAAALTALLFGIRAGGLLAGLQPGEAAARLSGLLIGAEIAGARVRLASTSEVVLVAAGTMAGLYGAALETAGIPYRVADADGAALAGLAAAARSLGWIGAGS